MMENSVKCEIVRRIGKITAGNRPIELCLVKWNENDIKYDIRRWDSDDKPLKGITCEKEEIMRLNRILSEAIISEKKMLPQYEISFGKIAAKVYDVFGAFSSKGNWKKYVTYTDWGYGPKYDLRTWPDDFSKCGKGVTLSEENVKTLISLVNREFTVEEQELPMASDIDKDLLL